MTLRRCVHDVEIRVLLESGHWPHAAPAVLRSHVAECRACADLVLLTQVIRSARQESVNAAQLPPPGVLWWRAQLRRRNAAVERVGRPILGAHIFALALTLLLVAGIALSQAKDGLYWLAHLKDAIASFKLADLLPDFSLQTVYQSAHWFRPDWSLPYLILAIGLLVLLGGVVVFLATEKQQ